MERSEHIGRMRKTSSVVIPLIQRAYARLAKSDATLASALSLFVSRRTGAGQPLLRPYLVRLGYELAGGEDWCRIATACAASEVVNISTYQANVAFDGKLTVATQEDRAEQFACAMMSLELAESMLESMVQHGSILQGILRDLRVTNRELYHGQLMDLRVLNVAGMGPDPDFDELLGLYDLRCRRLGGELTRWCLVTGAALASADGRYPKVLSKIGLILGAAGQMVNDVGDLVPIPASRESRASQRYQVVFSDVRCGKLTLPLIYAFRSQDSDVRRLTGLIKRDESCGHGVLLELTRRLAEIGAFAATRKKLIEYLREIRSLIRVLPPSQQRDHLTLAATTVAYNKYFTALRSKSFGF